MNHNTPLRTFFFFSIKWDVNYFRLHFRNESTKILCGEKNGDMAMVLRLKASVVCGGKQTQMCDGMMLQIRHNISKSNAIRRHWIRFKCDTIGIAGFSLFAMCPQSNTHSFIHPWINAGRGAASCVVLICVFLECAKLRRFSSLWSLIAYFHKSNGWMDGCILKFSNFNQANFKLRTVCAGLLWCHCSRCYACDTAQNSMASFAQKFDK